MFKIVLATLSILACVECRPQSASGAVAAPKPPGNVTTVKDSREPLNDKGAYKYDIELSDGTKFEQEGNTEAPGPGENETSIVIKGSYSYISPDGTPVNIVYIANKDGFQPMGDAIPKVSGASNSTASSSPAVSAPPAAAAASSSAPPLAASAPPPAASAPPAASSSPPAASDPPPAAPAPSQ